MSGRNTIRKGFDMARLAVVVALTVALLAAVQALGSPSGKTATARNVARTAQVAGTKIQVIAGSERTIVGTDDDTGYGGYDEVALSCPDNRTAIAGGFRTDSGAVWLNGSSPGATTSSWRLEVWLYGTDTAHWTPYVTCI